MRQNNLSYMVKYNSQGLFNRQWYNLLTHGFEVKTVTDRGGVLEFRNEYVVEKWYICF